MRPRPPPDIGRISPRSDARARAQNRILAALVAGGYRDLVSRMERVVFQHGDVVCEPGDAIRYVYFPETVVISMLSILENGDTLEVGLVGSEGMVGIRVFFGATTEPEQLIVQVGGTAMRMSAEVLRQELRRPKPLHRLLLRYTQALMRMISQSAACFAHHAIDRRLARWLLTMLDYVGTDELRFTQECISMRMGSRRPSVTMAAADLQRAGMLKYTRGRITVLDRKALEASACECYWVIRREYDRLHADIATLLSKAEEGEGQDVSRQRRPA